MLNKKVFFRTFLLLCVMLGLGIGSAYAIEQTVTIEVADNDLTFVQGDDFTARVRYDAAESTTGITAIIYYDSSKLALKDPAYGNLYAPEKLILTSGKPRFIDDDEANGGGDNNTNTDKRIELKYAAFSGDFAGGTDITLINLYFTTINTGSTVLNVTGEPANPHTFKNVPLGTITIESPVDEIAPVTSYVKVNNIENEITILQSVNQITLTAGITDVGTGGSNITAAEYFVDPVGEPLDGERGLSMTADTALDSPTETFTKLVDTTNWTDGQTHIIKVRGQDEDGNWSAFKTITINVLLSYVDPSVSTLSVNATTGKIANNADEYTFTVVAKKTDGTNLPNLEAALSVDGDATGVTFASTSIGYLTDGVGKIIFTMKSSKSGNFTVKATVDGITLDTTKTVTFNVGTPVNIALSAKDNKTQIVTDGSDSTVIQGTIQDAKGNTVTAYSSDTNNPNITFTVKSGSTMADFSGSTSATVLRGNVVNGVAEVTLKSKDVNNVNENSVVIGASGLLSTSGDLTITAANEKLDSISIALKTGSSATPKVGETTSFQATGNYKNPDGSNAGTKDITTLVAWNSTNTSKAAFKGTNDGILTAEDIGTTNITASFDGKTSTAIVVTVQAGDPVNINTFGLPTILNYDENFDLGAAVSGGSGAGFTYSVTDEPDTGAGIVSAAGVVSINATKAFAGQYTITVTDATNKQENTYSFEVPAVLSPNSGTFKEKDGAVTFAIKGVADSVTFTPSFLNASSVAISAIGSFSDSPVIDTDNTANNTVTFKYTPPNGTTENIAENKEFKASFTAQNGELSGKTIKSTGMYTIIALIDYSATVRDSATAAVLQGVEVTAVSLGNTKVTTNASGVFTFSDVEVSDADYTFSFAIDGYAPKTITLSAAEMNPGADVTLTPLSACGTISGTIQLDGAAGSATVKVKDENGNFFKDSSGTDLEVVSDANSGAFEMPIPCTSKDSATFTAVASTSGYVEGSVTVNNPDIGGSSISATTGTLNLKPATLITVKGELINGGVDLKISVNAAAGAAVFNNTATEVELTVTNAETGAVFNFAPVFDAGNNAWTKTIPNYDGSVIKIDVKADVSEDRDVSSGYYSQMTWYYVKGQQVPKVAVFDDPNTNGGGVATDDNSVKVQLPAGQLNAEFKKARFIIGPAVPATAGFTNVVGPVFTEIVLQDENGDQISNNDLEYVEITLQVEPGTSLDDFTKGERYIVRAANSADLKKEVSTTTLPTDRIIKVENNTVTFWAESLSAFGISEVPIYTPSIALDKTSGKAGNTVTITGTNFTSAFTAATVVMFDGATVAKTIVNGTTISFTVPAVQTVGNKMVMVNNSGESASAPFNVTVIAPSIALDTTSGPVGTTVTITGSNFTSAFTAATTVTFAGTAVAKTNFTTTTITFTVPAGQTAGAKTVQVTNAGESTTAAFTIVGPAIALSPASTQVGTAPSVTITGTNFASGFTDTTTVTFNGTEVTKTNFTTTTIIFAVPTGLSAGSYTVQVTNAGESASTLFAVNSVVVDDDDDPIVQPTQPKADFTYSPESPEVGGEITFTDQSTGTDSFTIDSWEWDFGDDSDTNDVQNPTHTYSETGSYTVTLRVFSTDNQEIATQKTITVVGVRKPEASFSVSPPSGAEPLDVVSFTDTSTGIGITGWSWTFGDGQSSTDQNPTHSYTSDGLYTVTLVVTNEAGDGTAKKTVLVKKDQEPPVQVVISADFSYTKDELKVTFADQSSINVGSITSWNWTFGNKGTSTSQNPVFTFPDEEGTYAVKLAVADQDGNSAEVTKNVVIVPPQDEPSVTAGFAPSTTSGYAPLEVNFLDTSTAENDEIKTWSWSFGDGGTSAEASPTHTYTQAGTFSARLSVTGASGLTSSKTMQITVTKDPDGCTDCPDPPTPGTGAPVDGSRTDTMTPDLEVTTPDGTASVQWQVATDAGFTIIIWDETGTGSSPNLSGLLLDPDTTYYWRSRVIDESGEVSEWSEVYSFVTPVVDSDDQDGSGVPDEQELDDPETVFPDVTQSVLTLFFKSVVGNISFCIEGVENVEEIVSARAYGNDGVTPPENTRFNWGFVGFKAKVTKNGKAKFKLHFSEKLSEEAVIKWYKANDNNELSDFSDYVTVSPSLMSITFTITDGGFGDADNTANGYVLDPLGPGTVEDGDGDANGDGDTSGNTCFIRSLAGVSSSLMIGIALLSGVLAFALGRKQQ